MAAKTAKTRKRRKRRKQENRENGENAKTAKTRKRENGENDENPKTAKSVPVFWFSISRFLVFSVFSVFWFSRFLVFSFRWPHPSGQVAFFMCLVILMFKGFLFCFPASHGVFGQKGLAGTCQARR